MKINFFGTKIVITFPFLALLSLLFLMDQTGTISVVIISAIMHEIGHLLAIHMQGDCVREIILSPIGASIVREKSLMSYSKERIIYLAGPMANFLIAFAFYIIFNKTGNSFYLYVAAVNLALAVFNLLPIASFDGAGVLLTYLYEKMPIDKAEKIKRNISLSALLFLVISGCYFAFSKHNNPTLAITATYMLVIEICSFKQIN